MKQVKKKKKIATNSYESYIQNLKTTIDKLEAVRPIYEYFTHLKRKRNCYIVEMRRIVALELFSQDYNLSEISKILSRNHASVLHIVKTQPKHEVGILVAEHYKEWITKKLYPISVVECQPSYYHPNGVKKATIHNLIPLP